MPVPYYTEEQERTLRLMFANYDTYEDIGRSIGRTANSVNQYVRKLGLKRNRHVSLLVKRHGADILKYGDTAELIYQGMEQARITEKSEREKAIRDRQTSAIYGLQFHLAKGVKRNRAIKIAFERGAMQTQIAKEVGITKQAVSTIIHPKVRIRKTKVQKHGKRYYYLMGCHCELCTAANTAYVRKRKHKGSAT